MTSYRALELVNMPGWFGGSSTAKPDPQAAAAIEQQIEMMDVVFMK